VHYFLLIGFGFGDLFCGPVLSLVVTRVLLLHHCDESLFIFLFFYFSWLYLFLMYFSILMQRLDIVGVIVILIYFLYKKILKEGLQAPSRIKGKDCQMI
jgi:hypothetical protein